MRKVTSFDDFLTEKLNNIFEAILTEEEERQLSDIQKRYSDFMFFGLAKFGAESPADLSEEDKKEFFNWIKDNWSKEDGAPKDDKIKDQIKKAKEKGLIPKEAPAAQSKDDQDKEKEKKAEAKKKEMQDLLK